MADAHKIVHIDINKINPAAYNPRNISDDAFKGLVESIKRFGMPQPLVVNKSNNILISGHQRLKAASEIGMAKVPVIYVELNDKDEKILNVTLNNPSIQGHFTESLQELLGDLSDDHDVFTSLKMDSLVDTFIPNLPDEEEMKAPSESNKFNIIVVLNSKLEQESVFDDLKNQGYKVKAQ
jgi:hypothetical protein